MAKKYDLAAAREIVSLPLSAGGLSADGEKLLVLTEKTEAYKNKDIYLRYPESRSENKDFEECKPEAFLAKAGVLADLVKYDLPHFNSNGWKVTNHQDKDGNKTTKDYYISITNKYTTQEYVGIPITKKHFDGGMSPSMDDILIIDKQSFLDNPNISMSLTHKRLHVENVDGKWAKVQDESLADRIVLPGNTIEANNPEELYLLTEAELDTYNSSGKRANWEEAKTTKEGLRKFEKSSRENGVRNVDDTRFVKEILIPQEVDGKTIPVKHYLMSDSATLESIKIMEPKKEQDIKDVFEAQERQNPSIKPVEHQGPEHFSMDQGLETEPPPNMEDFGLPSQEEQNSVLSTMDAEKEIKAQPVTEEKKVEDVKSLALVGLAKQLSDQITSVKGQALSSAEKAFLEDLNLIQDDPEKLKKALESIQNSPDHQNITDTVEGMTNASMQNKTQPRGKSQENPSDKVTGTIGEAAVGAAIGVGAGLVTNSFGLAKSAASGTMTAVNKIIEGHHRRKQERLDNPEIVDKERAASREKLMFARKCQAEDSNSLLDARIASVTASKEFIDEHPAVQQMYGMIEDNPSMANELEGWLESAAENNTVFAEHLNNVRDNAGNITRSVNENLQINSVAGMDLESRQEKFEDFNEKFTDDPLADAIRDAGLPDGQSATLRESMTKAINNMMKMLKDLMLRLRGKKGSDSSESFDQDGAAPAMSR